MGGQLAQVSEGGGAFRLVEFGAIPAGELVAPDGVVAVPLAQFG